MKLRSDVASAARKMTSSDRVARELRQLPARLREGEVVHRLSSGVYGAGYGLLAVTDQRVVLLQDRRDKQVSSGLVLKRLSVADWSPGEVAGTITIADSDSSIQLAGVSLAEGERLVEHVRSRMVAELPDSPETTSSSPDEAAAEPGEPAPKSLSAHDIEVTTEAAGDRGMPRRAARRPVTATGPGPAPGATARPGFEPEAPALPGFEPGAPARHAAIPSRPRSRSWQRHHRRGSLSRVDWLVYATAAASLVLTGIGAHALLSKPSTPTLPAAARVKDKAGQTVTVARVIDAASIETSGSDREQIRVLGILAPADGDCHAAESRAYATSTLRGATVTLIYDPAEPARDHSGHRQAQVKLSGGADYATVATRAGAVKYLPTDPPMALADQLKTAEADARKSNEGLWGPPCNGSFTATDGTDSDSADSPSADSGTDSGATLGGTLGGATLDGTAPGSTTPDSNAPGGLAADSGGAGGVDGIDRADSSTAFTSGTHSARRFERGPGSSSSQPDHYPRGEFGDDPGLDAAPPPRSIRPLPREDR